MSWEISNKYKTKCPCGRGQIIQEVKSDDWGRFSSCKPSIKCNKCNKKYKVIEIHQQSYYKWKGSNEEYYLVPIDFIEVEEPTLGYSFNIYEYKSFDIYITLTKLYKKHELEDALIEISNVNSCKEILKDYISYKIIKDLRNIYRTARIKQIRQSIGKALDNYQYIQDNKDELDKQMEIKKREFLQYLESVKTIGIKIDFSK